MINNDIPMAILGHTMPTVHINSSGNLGKFPNVVFFSRERKGKKIQLTSLALRGICFTADPILSAAITISQKNNPIFDNVKVHSLHRVENSYEMFFQDAESKTDYTSLKPYIREGAYTKDPICTTMDLRKASLSLQIKTASTIYLYVTPILLMQEASFDKRYSMHTLTTTRKQEFIDYLIEFNRKAYFQTTLKQNTAYQSSPSSLKRIKEYDDLNENAKRRKLNSTQVIEIEDSSSEEEHVPRKSTRQNDKIKVKPTINNPHSDWIYPN